MDEADERRWKTIAVKDYLSVTHGLRGIILGYLFGSGEPANNSQTTRNVEKALSNESAPKPAVVSQLVNNTKNVPAVIHRSNINNYLQMIPVFADHDFMTPCLNPIDVPRSWLWNLPRRIVYFGTSIPTIFKGFVCVRGFDKKTRAPRPPMARLHFPVNNLNRTRGKPDKN
ncbi:hypothetical protein BC332_10713 [Capsicum chinense]|nr:hypothetical protein BC332_10713 [Capsicum chinense]